MRDPFTTMYEQRQRVVAERLWFAAGLVVCGAAAAVMLRDSWWGVAVGVIAAGTGLIVLARWVGSRDRGA